MAEFAYEPEPEVRLAPGESVREISGRSPWQKARTAGPVWVASASGSDRESGSAVSASR